MSFQRALFLVGGPMVLLVGALLLLEQYGAALAMTVVLVMGAWAQYMVAWAKHRGSPYEGNK